MIPQKNFFFYKILILSTGITLFNLLTIGSAVGALGAIPLFLYIVWLLIKRAYATALFWHLTFISLSISAVLAHGMVEDGGELPTMYNYATLKLAGPVSVSYLITIAIFLCTLKKSYKFRSNTLLRRTLKLILYLAISGNLVGIIGSFFITGNSLHEFIKLNIYIWMTFITLVSVIKTVDKELLIKYFNSAVPLLCGAVLGASLGILAGVSTTYGGVEIPMTSDVVYYAPIIILAIFMNRRFNFIIFFSMLLYLFLMSRMMGGKSVFIMIFICSYLVYLIFFDSNYRKAHKKRIRTIRLCFITLAIIVASYIPVIMMDQDSLASYKIAAALSMLGGDVSNSPATRIAEFCNFVYNNRYDPFHLLFGMGYGGYFTDELRMLEGLDLSGGWTPEVISSGKFPSAHDTFSEVPLVNGFIGLFYLLYIGFLYIKRMRINYLAFAAVPWLILTFYFTPSLAFTAIYFLTGAEYNPDEE